MIRREVVTSWGSMGPDDDADLVVFVRDEVRAGRPVRITGLGTLACRTRAEDGSTYYPLTLTADVAKAETVRTDYGAATGLAADHFNTGDRPSLRSDVRHLARALGEPVEVWAPAPAIRASKDPGVLITTVQP